MLCAAHLTEIPARAILLLIVDVYLILDDVSWENPAIGQLNITSVDI